MGPHGPLGPGLGMMRVDGKHFLEVLFRAFVFFAIHHVIYQQQITFDVIGIAGQGGIQGGEHLQAITRSIGLRQAEVKIGVVRELLQSF